MTKLWEKKGRTKPKPLVHKEIVSVSSSSNINFTSQIGDGDALNTGSIMELRTIRENVAAWHKAVNDTKGKASLRCSFYVKFQLVEKKKESLNGTKMTKML